MKLLTKELAKALPPLRSQEHVADPLVVAKWFCPWSSWAWYALEGNYDPDLATWEFFGLVDGTFPEMGYWTLRELEEQRGGMIFTIAGKTYRSTNVLKIERDLWWTPTPLSDVRANAH